MIFQFYQFLNRSVAFIRWVVQVKSIDQLDSPYLFKFYRGVVQSIPVDERLDEIEQLQHQFLKETGPGETDLRNNDDYRKKSERLMEKRTVYSPVKYRLLYTLVRHYKPKDILELGTSMGISTLYLKAGGSESRVTTLKEKSKTFEMLPFHTIEWARDIIVLNDSFSNVLEGSLFENKTFDFILIKGEFAKQIIDQVMDAIKTCTRRRTIFLFDGIYRSREMTKSWRQLKADEYWNITIDLWYYGLLTFDPQIKEKIDVTLPPRHLRWHTGLFR